MSTEVYEGRVRNGMRMPSGSIEVRLFGSDQWLLGHEAPLGGTFLLDDGGTVIQVDTIERWRPALPSLDSPREHIAAWAEEAGYGYWINSEELAEELCKFVIPRIVASHLERLAQNVEQHRVPEELGMTDTTDLPEQLRGIIEIMNGAGL